ncbi:MAG TPA: hypothetical protein GXZ21_05520 [Clostridiales bacterium]|nr:hypothetical protein [Clostridiales bacterium]
MKEFEKKVKKRIFFSRIYIATIIIFIILTRIFSNDEIPLDFISGFSVGIGSVMMFYMAQYHKALKSEEELEKLYIEETDERQQYIKSMIGSSSITASIVIFTLGMLVSSFFNLTVFITLLIALMTLIIVTLAFKIYYNKKL